MTTYNKTESASLTIIVPLPGYGMLCNEDVILCNTEKFDCVGATIMTVVEHASTTYNQEIY